MQFAFLCITLLDQVILFSLLAIKLVKGLQGSSEGMSPNKEKLGSLERLDVANYLGVKIGVKEAKGRA